MAPPSSQTATTPATGPVATAAESRASKRREAAARGVRRANAGTREILRRVAAGVNGEALTPRERRVRWSLARCGLLTCVAGHYEVTSALLEALGK